jgi:hypothetical protein
VALRRDSLGNVVEEVQDGFSVTAALDLQGRPVSLQYPGGSVVDMPRDITGGISLLSDAYGVHGTYRHFGSGRLLEKRLACGVVLSYMRSDPGGILRNTAYNAAGEVMEQVYRDASGEVVRGSEYGRNRGGCKLYDRPLDGLAGGKGEVWRYDSVYRISRYLPNVLDPRVPPQDPLEKLVFYSDGNHSWRFIEVNFSQRRLTVNPRGGYATSDEVTFAYDKNGSLEGSGKLSFFYDALRRLKRVERSGSVVGLYRHDAYGCEDPESFLGSGRRIAKDVRLPARDQPAGFKRIVYWGDLPIEERDAEARLIRQYLHEGEGRVAVMIRHFASQPPSVDYFLHDGTGSITGVLDGSGGLQEVVKYGVHGEPRFYEPGGLPIYYSLVDNSIAFGGLYHDYELGFHIVRSRPFDPALGRYLTDVSPVLPEEPLQLNGYVIPGLPGLSGEIPGAGTRGRGAEYLEPLRVKLSGPRGMSGPWNPEILPAFPSPR